MKKKSFLEFWNGKVKYIPILVIVFVLALGGGLGGIQNRSSGNNTLPGSEDTTISLNSSASAEESSSGQEETTSPESDSETEGIMDAAAVTVSASIYVHVCGFVAHPGVYCLNEGARVEDAIAAAGGFRENADTEYWNQAQILNDAEQIRVPSKDESAAGTVVSSSGQSGSAASGSGTTQVSGSSQNSLVNINTADQATLMTLSGIGEMKAASIVAYRDEHGAFNSIEEVKNVSGIGDSTYDKIKGSITVG